MKQSLTTRKLIGFLFVSAAGTFLHFLYEITGESVFSAMVSAVNESIWEHMKLVFYPMLLFSLAEIFCGEGDKALLRYSTLAGILLALVLIPVLYYTYTGILGFSADWFNITIFFLTTAAAYYLEYRIEDRGIGRRISATVWTAVMILIAAAFTAATFYPPHIPLFRDPLTGTFGIWKTP